MHEIIYHIGESPFLVDERERGVLEVVHAIRFKGRDDNGTLAYGHSSTGERLIIGVDVEETPLDGLTLAVGSSEGMQIHGRRIEECLKLARVSGHEYVAIKEWDRFLSGAYSIKMLGGLELTTVTPRLFRKMNR